MSLIQQGIKTATKTITNEIRYWIGVVIVLNAIRYSRLAKIDKNT